MIKVTVHSAELRHIHGNAKATGKPYSMFSQVVYFHTLGRDGNPNPFPEKGEILVEKDSVGQGIPYAPGDYLLHPNSFYVGRNGALEVAPKLAVAKPR
jgi:Helix-destabilising protein